MADKNNVSPSYEIFSGEISQEEKKNSVGKEIWEWIYTLLIAVAVTFLIKYFFFDIVRVDGPSMVPTLMDNEKLIITKCGYEPKVGDIVILDSRYDHREHYMEEEKGGDTFISKYFPQLMRKEDLKPRYYVKRVIALEGQTIDFSDDGKVLVDGVEIDESAYYNGETHPTDVMMEFPLTVEEGRIFVMGDNRSVSKDSRSSELGTVDEDAVLGKAQVRIWPISEVGSIYKKD